jgi:hypothetical protein
MGTTSGWFSNPLGWLPFRKAGYATRGAAQGPLDELMPKEGGRGWRDAARAPPGGTGRRTGTSVPSRGVIHVERTCTAIPDPQQPALGRCDWCGLPRQRARERCAAVSRAEAQVGAAAEAVEPGGGRAGVDEAGGYGALRVLAHVEQDKRSARRTLRGDVRARA